MFRIVRVRVWVVWVREKGERKMIVTKLSVSVGFTVNTGDYNSARVDLSTEAEVGGEAGGVPLEQSAQAHQHLYAATMDRARAMAQQLIQPSKVLTGQARR